MWLAGPVGRAGVGRWCRVGWDGVASVLCGGVELAEAHEPRADRAAGAAKCVGDFTDWLVEVEATYQLSLQFTGPAGSAIGVASPLKGKVAVAVEPGLDVARCAAKALGERSDRYAGGGSLPQLEVIVGAPAGELAVGREAGADLGLGSL